MKWFKVICIIVLLLGTLFRFVNLDQKPYWHDETRTSLHISGYRSEEAIQTLYTGQVIQAKDILIYQRPSLERTVLDTIQGLATENSQHPPLYYAIARLWAGWFGAPIAIMRLLPALISLLTLPGMYWLCLELFGSSTVGWMAVILVAVSPIYVRYAQEAREYSLWMVIILLSSAMLLRTIRAKTVWNSSIYLLTLIAGLYCHILFGLVLVGHWLYVMLIHPFNGDKLTPPTKTQNPTVATMPPQQQSGFGFSSIFVIAIITFTPWLWTMWQHREIVSLTTEWSNQPVPFLTFLKSWSVNLCRLFIAWHFSYDDGLAYLAIPIVMLLIIAIYKICHQTPKQVWLFIVLLIGTTTIPLLLPDLIWAGKRSIQARYLLPAYLGIDLAIAYLLVHQLTQQVSHAIVRKVWQIITATLITSSVLTCALAAQADTWWGWSEFEVAISRIINRSTHPLVISDMPLGVITPLSHRLHPDTRVLLLTDSTSLTVPHDITPIFVYNPSDRLTAEIERQGIHQEVIYQFKDDALTITLSQLQQSHTASGQNPSVLEVRHIAPHL